MNSRKPIRILITGFEPFGPHDSNPSQMLANAVEKDIIKGSEIKSTILPVKDSNIAYSILKILDQYHPDIIIALGLDDKTDKIKLENLAVNIRHYNIPDNDGAVIKNKPIITHGPLAIKTGFDTDAMLELLVNDNIPATLSFHAGTFICNQLYYQILYNNNKAVFIHLPATGHKPDSSFIWSLDNFKQSLELVLNECRRQFLNINKLSSEFESYSV